MTPTDITPPEDHETKVVRLADEERAKLAKQIVSEIFTQSAQLVGVSVLKKAALIVAVGIAALGYWLSSKGYK